MKEVSKISGLSRGKTYSDLINKKFEELDFAGEWLEAIGKPEVCGSWLIYGNSGNGKTRFAMQLCKYFATFEKVMYNSWEEGSSKSMVRAIEAVGMGEVKHNFVLLEQESMEDLKRRLRKRKSPRIIFIDSWQYMGANYSDYKQLRSEFKNKLFIIISHADGKSPAGRTAKSINYDAFVKIWVEMFRAFPISRYGGGKPIDVWAEEAEKRWGAPWDGGRGMKNGGIPSIENGRNK